MHHQAMLLARVEPACFNQCFDKLVRIAFPVNLNGDVFVAEPANVARRCVPCRGNP
jgi:hypothetical protein